ncbi:Hypothetical predicted protein, partial [Marmota monax]
GQQYFVQVSAYNMKGWGPAQTTTPACASPSSRCWLLSGLAAGSNSSSLSVVPWPSPLTLLATHQTFSGQHLRHRMSDSSAKTLLGQQL